MKKIFDEIFEDFKLKRFLVDNVYYFIGCVLYAVGVNVFAVPNKIAQSGITGVAIIINHLNPAIQIGFIGFIINIPLLILAWFFLGKKFTAKTLWVTAMISAVIDAVKAVLDANYTWKYNGDNILAALFCGAMCGAGLGLIIMRGATSGGTDVIGRLLKKKWPHMSIGRMIMICDIIVIIAAAFAFGSVDSAMYAGILIFVSSEVMDTILYGTGSGKMLYIFTKEKGKEIATVITQKNGRGATIISGEGGYTGEESKLVVCAARSHEIIKIRKDVKKIDPEAFIVMTEVNEILGKGFSPPALTE